MFKSLFKRSRPASDQPATTPRTTASAPTPAPLPSRAETTRQTTLETFKEHWEEKWEPHDPLPAPEVIEGNGGNTDWGLWTDVVKEEENAFAPTEPMPLRAR